MVLVVSVFVNVSIGKGYAAEEKANSEYTVVDLKGSVEMKLTASDSLRRITNKMTLQPERELVMAKDATLKLKNEKGDEVILEGPMMGKLEQLLLLQKSKTAFVKKTLDKIPAAAGGEKKVDISTQSAGMTRGAKPHVRRMPYIWKVKKSAKAPAPEKKESREKK